MRTGRRGATRVFAAIAVAALVLLTGCSTAYVDPVPAPYERAPKDTKASITYAIWDRKQVPAVNKQLAEFHKEYPNIEVTIDVTPTSQYFTKLQTQASSGTLPDVFWMNAEYVQLYASHGKLAPITGAVRAGDIDPAQYPRALNELYTRDGVRYGVPRDYDTIGLWVNKKLFAEAGVPLPGPDMTWDQLRDTAVRISQKLGPQGVFGFAGDLSSNQTTYNNTIFQAGGTVIDGDRSGMDTPEAKRGIQFWRDMMTSGASPSFPQLIDSSPESRFASGRLAMYMNGSWYRAKLDDQESARDITVLPLPRDKERATSIHGLSNVVAASTPNQRAAQALQTFLAGKRAEEIIGESGSVIPAHNGTQAAWVHSLPPEVGLQSLVDSVAYAKPHPASMYTGKWADVEAELLPEIWSGARPAGEVLPELAQRVNRILAEEKEDAARG